MIMIRRATTIAMLFSAMAAAPVFAQGAPKLAFIDSRVVLERAPGRAAAEEAFKKETDGYRTQVQRMGDSLQTMAADYAKAEPTLTPAQKETRQKAIRDKQAEYSQRTQQLEQKAQQREFELMQPFMTHIREVLDAIRAEEGYTMIFDASSNSGVIVAVDKNLDITEKVIGRLKPIPVAAAGSAAPRDTGRAPAGARPAPAGVTRPPTKPPTQ